MKRTPKFVFFIVFILIAVLTYTAIMGVHTKYGDRIDTVIRGADEIRTGVDISGGVEVIFTPKDSSIDATDAQIAAMRDVIERRMIAEGITDYEAYADNKNDQVIVRFPWEKGTDNDAAELIKTLGATELLEMYIYQNTGTEPTAKPTSKADFVLDGNMVESAQVVIDQESGRPLVALNLKASGKTAFSEATKKQYGLNVSKYGTATSSYTYSIAIWRGDSFVSAPTVNAHIDNGEATITLPQDITEMEAYEMANDMVNQINAGSLPFSITDKNVNIITATLGERSLEIMILAGAIALVLVSIFMIAYYRLPGLVAVIALIGQVAGSIAAVSGFFGFFSGFTLTLPGIAGMILSIGMGVDANIITSERIKEQIRMGKTIDTAIQNGCRESFSAIFDGNITVIIISVVLMGVFGPSDTIFAQILSPILSWFPVSTSGAIYAFGYTLLAGIVFNFVMGVFCSRLMLKSLSRFKFLRKPWLLGGKAHE